MNQYRLGIIGAGMYGKVLMRSFQQDPRAQITWVNSASEATAREAAESFGVPRWTLDYHELLAAPDVDAVVVATPPYLHAEQGAAALAAGKHLLLEKPMAESAESVQKILDAAAAAPHLITLEASCRHTRLTPKFRLIKELIDSGKLGQVYHIHHNHLGRGTFIEWNPKGAWAMNKKLAGGGPFIDLGVYGLSFHLGLLDDQPELLSLQHFHRNDLRDMSKLVGLSDIEQHGAAWLNFSHGLTYYYECGGGVHSETANETRIYGTRGGLRFQFPSWESNEIEFFYVENDIPQKQTLTLDPAQGEDDGVAIARHFLDCLDGNAQPKMSVATAAKHMGILFQILS